MFCTSTHSCARVDDAKIVRSRDAQCNTEELPYGDSRVLHYAFLLRTIFASSARAHERAREQNIRDFPQTKLVREIKSFFCLKRTR